MEEMTKGIGDAVDTILNTGAAIGRPQEKDELLYAIVPEGYELATEDIADRQEKREPTPRRITGSVSLANVDSFLEFCGREYVEDTTVCFANLRTRSFAAIFNYAAPGGVPGWSDRSATLTLGETTNWKRWLDVNGEKMGQLSLADFLEANMDDIFEPDAADIIEMITALKVRKNAEFHSIIDQNTGLVSMQYSEDVKGESIKGQIDFIGKFTIGLSPFYGSSKYSIKCNLRMSTNNENRLLVHVQLINHQAVIEDAFNVEREKILQGMKELNIPVFDQ